MEPSHVDKRHYSNSNHSSNHSTIIMLEIQLLWTINPMYSCTEWQVGRPELKHLAIMMAATVAMWSVLWTECHVS
jgi:hypothetical protein